MAGLRFRVQGDVRSRCGRRRGALAAAATSTLQVCSSPCGRPPLPQPSCSRVATAGQLAWRPQPGEGEPDAAQEASEAREEDDESRNRRRATSRRCEALRASSSPPFLRSLLPPSFHPPTGVLRPFIPLHPSFLFLLLHQCPAPATHRRLVSLSDFEALSCLIAGDF